LLIFDTKTGIVKQSFKNIDAFSSPSQNQIKQIYNDNNGNVWFATWEGLHSFNEKENKLLSFNNKDEISALNNNAINCVLQDKSGIIWVGTSFGGVNYFNPNMENIKLVHQSTGLSNNIISSFAEDNSGNIWVGTIGGGINKIDAEGRVLEQINSVNSNIKNDLVRSLAIKDNYLWIGYWDNYLSRYNILNRKFKHYNLRDLEFDVLEETSVRSIFVSKDNCVWLGTSSSGLIKFSPTGEVIHYSPNSNNPLLGNNTKKMFYDTKGDFWVLNKHGLNRFDEKNKTFKQYYFEKNDPINNSEMMNVYVDNSNIFWVGTYGNGLIKLDVETMKYENYTANSNLSSNVVYGILPDEDGLLWLSTNNGLARFNPRTGKRTNFNVEDGLQSNEFNDNAFLKTSNGALFFGGIAGINIIKPSAIKKNTFVPPIEITNISLLNSSIEKNNHPSRIKDKKLVLDYSENDLSIEFAALNYWLPNRNLYAYKLEPVNDNWINLNTRRELTFTNLEPGNYILRIKGSNNDGIWNETGTKLSITILPPFWMTWWFRTLSVLLIIGIIATIIFIKINELLRVEKLRIKIASDLHDDVGASLTKITMNAGLLDYETEQSKIKIRTQNLIDLSQNVISTMSDIVWSIDARNDTIGDMIDRMKNFSLNLASEKGIEVNFNIVSPNPNRKVNINKRQNFYLIYKEAFHNAVKYAETSAIDVKISALKNELNFELADNGIGLPKENRRKGNGIRNMKMRAERINADLIFLNENGLTIRLNVKKL
jgi:ligand-binding sensor domain-containing protein/two-component sensor histidine kinase